MQIPVGPSRTDHCDILPVTAPSLSIGRWSSEVAGFALEWRDPRSISVTRSLSARPGAPLWQLLSCAITPSTTAENDLGCLCGCAESGGAKATGFHRDRGPWHRNSPSTFGQRYPEWSDDGYAIAHATQPHVTGTGDPHRGIGFSEVFDAALTRSLHGARMDMPFRKRLLPPPGCSGKPQAGGLPCLSVQAGEPGLADELVSV